MSHPIPSFYLSSTHNVAQERYVVFLTPVLGIPGYPPPAGRIHTLTASSDSFPSSAAFDAINQTLQADEGERKNAVNSAKAIVAFNLKNAKGEEKSWYLDLKNKGEVGQGAAPAGGKADGELHFYS